ncbi:MAG: hypothetical protein IJU26_01940 [Synergistaceae bacterium]|nr:hypothetical protein [Synergistaceae bacterium]
MLRAVVIAAVIALFAAQAGAESVIHMKIDDVPVAVEWENNETVKALAKSLPLTVKMHMYSDFEQVGSLGRSLPRNDRRITTKPGDIVLYSGNQIVIFYGANTWAYTRLGRVAGKTASELADLLGKSDVTLTLSGD